MEQLDHTAFLASLPPEDRSRLTETRDGPALVHLAGHLALIAGFACWVIQGWPFWIAALFPLGVALVFLFTPQHECTHRTPFRAVWANEVVGSLIGLVLIQPFAWFRAFHMAHHRHTNDPALDPECATEKPAQFLQFARHLSGVDYWPSKLQVLLGNALNRLDAPYIGSRQKRRIRWEARVMLAAYAIAALLFGTWLFWLWLLPLALGFPVLRLYLLAEHGRCPAVANMFENTRTTLTNRAVRWLAWNMPYHAEHHAWPQVPFHQLPEVHRKANVHLRQVSNGYSGFTREYVGTFGPAQQARAAPPPTS